MPSMLRSNTPAESNWAERQQTRSFYTVCVHGKAYFLFVNISTIRKKEILLLSLLNCNIIFMIIIIIRITPVFVMLIKLKQSTSAFRFTNAGWIIVKAEGVTLQPFLKKCWKFPSFVFHNLPERETQTPAADCVGFQGGFQMNLWHARALATGQEKLPQIRKKHKQTHMGEVTYWEARGSALPTLFCLQWEGNKWRWDKFRWMRSFSGCFISNEGHIWKRLMSLLHVTHPQSHCCRSDQAGPTSEAESATQGMFLWLRLP